MSINVLLYLFHPKPVGYIGGGFTRTIEILKRANLHGVNFVVIENQPTCKEGYGVDYEVFPINTIGLPNSPPSYIIMMMQAVLAGVKMTKRRKMDLIVSSTEQWWSIVPTYLLSKLTKIPWTVILHLTPAYGSLIYVSKDCNAKFKSLYKEVRRKIHVNRPFTAVLDAFAYKVAYFALKDTISLTYGTTAEDLHQIDNRLQSISVYPGIGIDFDRISLTPTPEKKTYDAIFAATIIPEKGIFDLIDAWECVTKKNPCAKLVVLGKGSKDIVHQIKERIKEHKLEDNVFFLCDPLKGATLEEVWTLMKKAKMLVHPSTRDSWPQVVGEALACGIPAITYDVRPVKYAYGDCPVVFRVLKGDTSELATQILKLLKNPPEDVEKRANQCAKCYNWDAVVEGEKRAYGMLLKRVCQHKLHQLF